MCRALEAHVIRVFYQQQEHREGVQRRGARASWGDRSAEGGVVNLPDVDFVRNAGMF